MLIDENSPGYPLVRCVRCRSHDGDSVEAVARRDGDHVELYKHALVEAQNDAVLAESERDVYRDQMQAAYGTREMLVKIMSEIDAVHHVRGNRCACGKRGCKVVRLLGDPRVARLIRGYDEEQRTLRELRNANPELWAETWDCIDVTLVYPQRQQQRPTAGRHRAAG
ncbi:MAG TPA: hypothetical protein VFH38_08370 [Jatrophihabitans sp.]|nr:hypothetical protein [Jatrophihabitans sp.]